MVKDQVDVEVVAVQGEALLPGDEREALAQFDRKRLDCRAGPVQGQVSTRAGRPRNWMTDRSLEDVDGLGDLLSTLVANRISPLPVLAQCKPFEELVCRSNSRADQWLWDRPRSRRMRRASGLSTRRSVR